MLYRELLLRYGIVVYCCPQGFDFFSSRGFATDGAARAEIKLAYSLPSRDGGRQLVNPRVT